MMAEALPTGMWWWPLLLVGGVISIVVPVYAVTSQNKTIASMVQMGSLQRRFEATEQLTSIHEKKASLKLWDKLTFTWGVFNVAFTTFFLGSLPTRFYLWYSPKAIILIGYRFLEFRCQNKHYLLYDFCYWANFLVLLYVWVWPHNPVLFQIIFLAANGPLAWSMLAFSHSTIFHSRPHMTSVFIHASPMLFTYGLRWFPSEEFTVCGVHGCEAELPFDLIYNCLSRFYLWWLVLYYIWIFLILDTHIRTQGLQTLFDRVTGPKGPLKFLGDLTMHPLLVRAIYMGIHLFFGVLTMILSVVHWYSFWTHAVFCMTMCTATAWNAAGFYFNVFTRSYDDKIKSK